MTDLKRKAGTIAEVAKNAHLIWRLLKDGRISPWTKMILPAALLYLLSPIDLIPDLMLGLGQLDDIAVILLGLRLFIELCPKEIVQQHLNDLASITVSYRVLDDGETREENPSIDGHHPN